jgi:hypothetical protein
MRAIWPLIGIVTVAFVGSVPFFFLWGSLLYSSGHSASIDLPAPFYWIADLIVRPGGPAAFLVAAWLFSFVTLLVLLSLLYWFMQKRATSTTKQLQDKA